MLLFQYVLVNSYLWGRGVSIPHPEDSVPKRVKGKTTKNLKMNRNEICKAYFYILTNKRKTVLYAGSIKDLVNRLKEHEKGYQKGFTQKYNVNRLIYYEVFEDIDRAKKREREIKGWKREKKVRLIELKNKQWMDLFGVLTRDSSLGSE